MNPKIRNSVADDATHFVSIKRQLKLNHENSSAGSGGFILGTDIDTYKFYIEKGWCSTAISDNRVVGFGIILPNQLVRQSHLWQKKNAVDWLFDFKSIKNKNLCYFEQLAFLKGFKKLSLRLAFSLTKSAFDRSAEYLLTTTVQKPIRNMAAVPYIKAVGGKCIGQINEVYPEIGAVLSDIYLIDKKDFYQKTAKLFYFDFLEGRDF